MLIALNFDGFAHNQVIVFYFYRKNVFKFTFVFSYTKNSWAVFL